MLTKNAKKILSLLLTVCLVPGMLPLTTAAEVGGICTHEHGENCSYVAGAPGSAPTAHDETCEYIEDEDDSATPSDAHRHDVDCGYMEAVDCDHVCDADSGGLSLGDSGKPMIVTEAITVAELDALPDETLWQGYDFDTVTVADLVLPDTLTGADADGEPVMINGVTWESAPDFDPVVSAWYYFSPTLRSGYILAEGVSAPVISVFIRPEGGVVPWPMTLAAGSTIEIGGLTGIDLTVDHNATACSSHSHTPTGWSWDATTDTLTLASNYSGEGIYIKCGVSDNITLVLNGNVTINSADWGISVVGISGAWGGSLTVRGDSFTLNATGGSSGLQAQGGVFIESGTVSATGDSQGICSYNGDVTISGSASVTATGTGLWSNGIQAAGDVIIDTTGTVTASGGDFSGIRADGSIQIADGTVTAKGGQNGALNAENGIVITGGTIATDNSVGGAGGNVCGHLTVSGAATQVTVNGDVTDGFSPGGNLTVLGGTVTVTGDVTGDLAVSDGMVTINGDVGGAATVTGGIVEVNGAPILPTTYIATLNITQDGAPYASDMSGYALKLSGNESTAVRMVRSVGTGAARTASVPNGTWKVYLGADEYTGVDIIVNGGPASAMLEYYSQSHSVNPQGSATGGTISISINGTDYGHGSLSFMKGDEAVFTAAGIGAASYTYAWSGTHGTATISGTGATFTIPSVSGKVDITCAITGSNTPGIAHTIMASAGTGGSISPSGSVTVNDGANQTFTITPGSYYSISDVKVDGVSVGAVCSYTFSNVTVNHTISATFYYSSSGGSGGGSSSGSSSLGSSVYIWKQDEKGWWLEAKDGSHPQSAWQKVNGSWYYFDEFGYMVSNNWVLYNGRWYFLNPDGSMATGWVKWNGIWYYQEQSGAMLADTKTPDGYYVNENGEWVP